MAARCVCATGESRREESSEGRPQDFPAGHRAAGQRHQQTPGERLHLQARRRLTILFIPSREGYAKGLQRAIFAKLRKVQFCLTWCFPWTLVPLQGILLHGGQAARQGVCLHRPEHAERDAGVPRLPLPQEESGESRGSRHDSEL